MNDVGVNGAPVGGAQHDDGAAVAQAVHEAQQRRHEAGEHLVRAAGPRRHQRVQLVQEDDRRRQPLRLRGAGQGQGYVWDQG